MIETIHRVICDGCGWWDSRCEASNRTDAVNGARAAGYTVGKRVLCQPCREAGK
jgi:hypothetical protein